jgi:hypothetical protein
VYDEAKPVVLYLMYPLWSAGRLLGRTRQAGLKSGLGRISADRRRSARVTDIWGKDRGGEERVESWSLRESGDLKRRWRSREQNGRRKKRLMWWLAATVFTAMLIIALMGFHRLLSNNRAR